MKFKLCALLFFVLIFINCQNPIGNSTTTTIPATTTTIIPATTTSTTTTTVPVSITIMNKDTLARYLEENLGTCQTSIGPTNFTFYISENTTINYPEDFDI